LTTYASVLSALGVGVTFTETEHHVLLAVAVLIAVGIGSWRARREQRLAPFAVAAGGCAVLVTGHAGEIGWLEWAGIAILVVGPLLAVRRHPARHRRAVAEGTIGRPHPQVSQTPFS